MIILCFRASAIPRPNFPDSGVCQTFVVVCTMSVRNFYKDVLYATEISPF